MTKINKMVMNGFKSFAKPTELLFCNGFNCVIGPNGSGKSNILDALCFVLGRMSAKSMRAEKSANLIYNGGKTQKPAKEGEVSLFFDNSEKTFPTDEKEVKITRIIKKDGQSVYKINDEKRTRQQIIDLMSIARIDSSGFNIVLQGDIVRFTEMPPEQRREIIEEISGISVYEEKKHKALRELDKVDQRLKEASIVLTERNTYLNELKKERDQAMKYKELQDNLKENKASYLYVLIEQAEKDKAKHDEKIEALNKKLSGINTKVEEIKAVITEKKKRIEDINNEMQEKGERGQVKIQKEIEELKVRIATKKARKDSLMSEIDKIKLRKDQFNQEIEENNKKISELKERLSQITESKRSRVEEQKVIEAEIGRFRGDDALKNASQIEEEIDNIDKGIEQGQVEIDALRKRQQDLLRHKDSLEYQISSIDDSINKVKEVEKEHKAQVQELEDKKVKFKEAVLELNKRLAEDSSISSQIRSKKDEYHDKQEEVAKLKAREAHIKEKSQGSIAIKNILDQNKKGVYGTVRDLAKVKPEYEMAIETAAGQRLNSIIVDNDNTASDCIKHLKKNKLGSATFLPLNKIKSRIVKQEVSDLCVNKGVEGIAIDLVSFDQRYENAFSHIFGDTLVLTDIDVARDIGVGKARMVTLSGDITETSGAMHGGYVKKRSGGFDHKKVNDDLLKAKKDVAELEEVLNVLNNRKEENEKKIDDLRKTKADLEGETIKIQRSLHLQSGDIDADQKKKDDMVKKLEDVDKQISKVEDDIDVMVKSITDSKIKRQKLKEKINDIRNPEQLAQLSTFEEKLKNVIEEIATIEAEHKSLSTQLNEMRMPEQEKLSELIKGLDRDKENFDKEMSGIHNELEELDKELSEKEDQSRKFYSKSKELFSERNRINDEIGKFDQEIEDHRESSKGIEIEMNQESLVNAEVKAKLSGLRESFSEYEGVKINKDKSLDQLKKDISKFEKMEQGIGSVNMKALEIYEDVEKEYNSLLSKKDKLKNEKDDVLEMMDEIDSKKKDLFMKAFNAVNSKFQEFFLELSTKGEASLELENEEKPFEGGLNMKVRIAGKKFLDTRSLSGGEKTMTALAFIFAIQEYQPHSFYIMDEVDAALDKHNSEKLSTLIRKYTKKAQYIVISHNDSVITEADNLYGISMGNHGISNVTTLKI